jgi:uncharacterized protein (TIGR02099 family)
MARPSWLAWRWLLYLAAAGIITLALLVGILRLLLPLVPQYQDDIRAWANDATGYQIDFRRISASWPLAGPELSFAEVTLSRPGEAQPILAAREFSVGVSVLRLLRDLRPAVSRLSVRGASVAIERTADGGALVQGRRLEELLPRPSGEPLPEIRVDLRDIAVRYADARRQPVAVPVSIDRLRVELGTDSLQGSARIGLPEEYGGELRAEVDLPMPLPSPLALPAQWQARLMGTDLDLVRLLTLLLGETGPLRAGTGDLDIEIAVRDARLQRLAADVDLAGVGIGPDASLTVYQQLSGRGEWTRSATGWNAAIKRLRVRRDEREFPENDAELQFQAAEGAEPARWKLRAGRLRLDDFFPMVRAGVVGTELESRLPRDLRGDIRDLEGAFAAAAGRPTEYALQGRFANLQFATAAGDLAAAGLTGTVDADAGGGRLQLDSSAVNFVLPGWFRDALDAQQLRGLLVWRAGADGVRLLSDDISVKAAAIDIRSRFEMQFPADGASPVIDLTASASATEARQVLRYLPLRHFPPKVVDWLERAVVGGRVSAATAEFRGPVREFPFAEGNGTFRVAFDIEDGTLDYADGWPRIEGLSAGIVFDGVSMSSTTNRARLGRLALEDFTVRIPDLRKGVLAVSGRQRVSLDAVFDFLRATPINDAIGPTLGRITAAGPVDAALRLALPVGQPARFDLDALFDARGCRLGLQPLPLDLRDLRGRVRLRNTRLSGEGIRAVMLGEPVGIRIRPEAAGGDYTHVADLSGATPAARLISTFKLPGREYFDGRLAWDASVRFPVRREPTPAPLVVSVRSDLRGIASVLPQPLRKSADEAWPTALELRFPPGEVIEISGSMQPPFAWALQLASTAGGWQIDRGELHAGPGEARIPSRGGLVVTGAADEVRLNDWLALGGGAGEARPLRETFRQIDLQVQRFAVAGQLFRDARIGAARGADAWAVSVSGPNAEGRVTVPFDLAARPLVLDMQRLWLLETDPGAGEGRTDPRSLMAAQARVGDAALGSWRLGRLELDIDKSADGLVARRISTTAESFQIDGAGAWLVAGGDVARQQTSLQATLRSNDIRETLVQLGFDPGITGKKLGATVDLTWPGGPSADFLTRASGAIGIEMEKGQIVEIEPGSGRLLGLLSVTALPRRLALDFRDVFNEGLAFDTIKGDFQIGAGSAYTCNLGLTGPVAEIAIVGRTGFSTREYDQVAVVRPQVSNVLTVGGAVLGGPVGGVTMALLAQLFRKPLSTLGESYYRVSGGWDKPDVVPVERDQVQLAAFKDCEKVVVAALEAGAAAEPRAIPPAGGGAGR